MFSPVLHNLESGTELFSLCQAYNEMITRKSTKGTLEQKVAAQRVWKNDCADLLVRINQARE